jgi:hypothetical protein
MRLTITAGDKKSTVIAPSKAVDDRLSIVLDEEAAAQIRKDLGFTKTSQLETCQWQNKAESGTIIKVSPVDGSKDFEVLLSDNAAKSNATPEPAPAS